MKNIVLTGFMASGKTVVGKKLAKITGYKFIDIDQIIEKQSKKTINEIFKEFGECFFRKLESDAVMSCKELEDSVIACGGGTVLRLENIEVLRKKGIIFNLNPTENIIRRRFSFATATRPLLLNKKIDDVLKQFYDRKQFYDVCDFKIEVSENKKINEITKEILMLYKTTWTEI